MGNAIEKRTLPGDLIKILIIDDNPLDAELFQMQLRRAGIVAECRLATGEAELIVALRTFVADVVLCDFSLPGFDGFAAQRLVREVNANVPLIFVSGTISEDRAVAALQSGAVDYVLKSNLVRLPSAVRRAVGDSRAWGKISQSLETAEELARRQAERLTALWQIVNNPTLRGHDRIQAMLRQGAEAIRPPQSFRGFLSRIEDGDTVVVAVGAETGDELLRVVPRRLGERVATTETLIPRNGRTQAWEDLANAEAIPEHLVQRGWRATIITRFEVGEFQYKLVFASPAPALRLFGPEDISYVELLGSAFANQVRLDQLAEDLRDQEERARQHAERLEGLWRLVNDPSLRDAELWLAMLRQAAAAIRPGQVFRGTLFRVEGSDLILEAVALPPDHTPLPSEQIGARAPLESTVVGKLLAEGGGTRSWDNVQASEFANERSGGNGTHSLVITTFGAGGTTWTLSFASDEAGGKPFGSQEHAYIEVLASFFANHVQQRWQYDRIAYQQSHDVLTGLLNRSQFRSQARALATKGARYAVIVVDISSFREVNASYGTMTGDALLVEVANALRQRISGDELLGRIGGDVFGIYVPNPVSREFVRGRALEFAEIFARSFSTGDREGREFIALSACVGVATAPEDAVTIEKILSHADAAIAAAKERGSGAMVFYEAGMEGEAQRRGALRSELADAIAGDQFTLYFQPHLELGTGIVSGCEALIRWNHPVRGVVLPGHFIPFAEQTGIITAIDALVMRKAFAAAKEINALRPDFRLYFNLSGRQAGDPRVIRAFTQAAREGVVLENIGIEITESDAMRDVEATRRVCRALRKLGVRIAIDDFGTGYSSLSSLKRLPVDIVKIDRTFISGLPSDPHDETIAETIIAITERFGFESLAEGAEQPEQVDWLRAHKCHYVQGFAICHPLPLDEFKSWLTARASAP